MAQCAEREPDTRARGELFQRCSECIHDVFDAPDEGFALRSCG